MLVLLVPGFALLGAFAAYDNGERTPWLGLAAGAAVGVFFGCVFGGDRRWRLWDYLFGPGSPAGIRTRCRRPAAQGIPHVDPNEPLTR
jgi:hypothetical protein